MLAYAKQLVTDITFMFYNSSKVLNQLNPYQMLKEDNDPKTKNNNYILFTYRQEESETSCKCSYMACRNSFFEECLHLLLGPNMMF